MQIVILAWWLGTRLRPITESIPKPMVEINSKPFLYYQLEMIKKYWFKDVLILVWYLWNMIEEYFWNWSQFWLNISYNYEKTPLGTWWWLKLAQDKLDDEFILLYGDSFLDYDYNKLIELWHNSIYDIVVTAYDNISSTDVINNLEVIDSKVIRYMKWVQDNKLNYVESWVNYMKKVVLNQMQSNKVISLEEEIFPSLIKQWKMWAYIVNNRFYDIWTFSRLDFFKNFI